MRKSRQTEISIEVDQHISVKRRPRMALARCASCGTEVVMLTPDEATSIGGVSTRDIFRLLDRGEIHFAESSQGLIRLCLPSLLEAAGKMVNLIQDETELEAPDKVELLLPVD